MRASCPRCGTRRVGSPRGGERLEATQRSDHRRSRPRRRAVDAEGRRVHRRRPRQAADRCRDHLDRDDAVQPEPARAGAGRQARDPRGGRDADGVQHDRGLRRRLDGHRGNAREPRLARGDRRLDRARLPWPPARRARLPGRLRQDEPGGGDGGWTARHPDRRALHRIDRARPLPRQGGHGRRRLRGHRRVRRREDLGRGPERARGVRPAPAPAPAAGSSPRTRCRRSWSSSGSARRG